MQMFFRDDDGTGFFCCCRDGIAINRLNRVQVNYTTGDAIGFEHLRSIQSPRDHQAVCNDGGVTAVPDRDGLPKFERTTIRIDGGNLAAPHAQIGGAIQFEAGFGGFDRAGRIRGDHDRHPGWSRLYATVLSPGEVAVGDEVVVEP